MANMLSARKKEDKSSDLKSKSKTRLPLLILYICYVAFAAIFAILHRVGFFEKHSEILDLPFPTIMALAWISIAMFFGLSIYASYKKGFGRTMLNPIIHGLGSFTLGYFILSIMEGMIINPVAFALMFGLPAFLLWFVPSLVGTVIGSLARRA